MIVGVGVDIIEVDRICRALANPRTGERFRERVFTEQERAYCSRKRNAGESFAARFAAKEATMKALGRAFAWQEIEVWRQTGAPSVKLHGRALAEADSLGVRRLHLSLSHTALSAVACVVAET
jgi:holo-[acyl-carrier protein] synthase